jgi:membrane protease YdiL (CAAX protease family)
MSTDFTPDDPRERKPATDISAEEPPLVEAVEDEEPIVLVRRRRRPPSPPQPGFWWAIGWCVMMVIVAQVIPAIVVAIVVVGGTIIVDTMQNGPGGAEGLSVQDLQQQVLLPTVLCSQVMLILFSLVVLRLIVGRSWRYQIALRLPSAIHVVLAVLLFVPLAFLANLFYGWAKALPNLNHLLTYFLTLCATLAVVGAVWGLVRVTTGYDWVKVLARRPVGIQLVLAPLECLGIAAVAVLIFRLLDPHILKFDLDTSGLMENFVQTVRTWPPLAGVLIVGLGPGLGEELWCRAFLGRGLVGRHGVVMGVILTSLFFGAIHVDPHQGTMAALMGLFLYFSYLMTRSLWVPMLMHFLNNSLSVIGERLAAAGSEQLGKIDTDPAGIPWTVFVAAGCVAAAVCWAFYTSRARLVRTDGSGKPP